MSYIDSISAYNPLTFDNIIRTAKENVPSSYKERPWQCPGLNHGTATLENEAQLCCYLAAYGDMHKGKLDCAISQFPFKNIDSDFERGCVAESSIMHASALSRCDSINAPINRHLP